MLLCYTKCFASLKLQTVSQRSAPPEAKSRGQQLSTTKSESVTVVLLTDSAVHILGRAPPQPNSAPRHLVLKHTLFWREAADFTCLSRSGTIVFAFRAHRMVLCPAPDAQTESEQHRAFLNTLYFVHDAHRSSAARSS